MLLGPAAVVLGVTQPSRSWRWGLWLTWPTVVLSVSLLASPQLSTVAVISLPLVTVLGVCALAWLAAVGRESIGGLLAEPRSNADAEVDTSLIAMTDEELAAEASWDRPVKTAREHKGKRHRRRRL